MLNEKLNLMLLNSQKIDNVDGSFGMSMFKKCNALTLTMKNVEIDVLKVNNARRIIKDNTSVFSNFRGYNLLTTAVNLSLFDNPTEAFNEILDIYGKLKNEFYQSTYLVLVAHYLYINKNVMTIDEAIRKTRYAYDKMKKNHFFLTSSDDVMASAMIAMNSNDLEKTFEESEECYKILNNRGFFKGNNLQALSNILCFAEGTPEEKCNKVILFDKELRNINMTLKGYALPILGIAILVTDNYKELAVAIKETDMELKKHSGFGALTLGYTTRSMISAALTCSSYLDASSEINNTFTETTKNAVINIIIAMQIAASAAAAGAAAGAASS
ncbi:MAG: DUF4003 family protein [Clostridium sp.]